MLLVSNTIGNILSNEKNICSEFDDYFLTTYTWESMTVPEFILDKKANRLFFFNIYNSIFNSGRVNEAVGILCFIHDNFWGTGSTQKARDRANEKYGKAVKAFALACHLNIDGINKEIIKEIVHNLQETINKREEWFDANSPQGESTS